MKTCPGYNAGLSAAMSDEHHRIVGNPMGGVSMPDTSIEDIVDIEHVVAKLLERTAALEAHEGEMADLYKEQSVLLSWQGERLDALEAEAAISSGLRVRVADLEARLEAIVRREYVSIETLNEQMAAARRSGQMTTR